MLCNIAQGSQRTIDFQFNSPLVYSLQPITLAAGYISTKLLRAAGIVSKRFSRAEVNLAKRIREAND